MVAVVEVLRFAVEKVLEVEVVYLTWTGEFGDLTTDRNINHWIALVHQGMVAFVYSATPNTT